MISKKGSAEWKAVKRASKASKVAVCPVHNRPFVVVTFCPACRGGATSDKKATASRANGQKGGRPAKSKK